MLRCHLLVDARAASFHEVDSSKALYSSVCRIFPSSKPSPATNGTLGGRRSQSGSRAVRTPNNPNDAIPRRNVASRSREGVGYQLNYFSVAASPLPVRFVAMLALSVATAIMRGVERWVSNLLIDSCRSSAAAISFRLSKVGITSLEYIGSVAEIW